MSNTQKKHIGRPPAWLWFLIHIPIYLHYRLRYRIRLEKNGCRIKGPALVLAPHTAACDPFLIGITLYPTRPNYVVSAHLFANKYLRRVLCFLRVIPKRMFSADASTILNIRRAMNENNVVVIFPEGRLPCFGHSLPIADGTEELVHRLGVDVYTVTNNGAFLSFPKWGKKPRRGKIRIVTQRILTAEEALAQTPEEIRARLDAALLHDDEKAMEGIVYKSKDTTKGVDGILYRCPACLQEGTLSADHSRIRCTCGFVTSLTPWYKLLRAPFSTVGDWYRWQEGMLDTSVPLSSRVTVATPDENGNMQASAGSGNATLSRESFTFDGTVSGQSLSFSVPTSCIGGLPISVAKHFDVYFENRLYCFSPQPDPRTAVKWVSFLDKVHAEEKAAVNSNR